MAVTAVRITFDGLECANSRSDGQMLTLIFRKIRMSQIQRKKWIQINGGAGDNQFLMEKTRLNEGSYKQSTRSKFKQLQAFRANDMATELQEKIMRVKELHMEVLMGYFKSKLENLDMTGEQTSQLVRIDINSREMTIKQWVRNEMDAAILAGELDLPDERETQIFAIHCIKMTETIVADIIMSNRGMVTSELLSTNHALRIVTGVAQMRREVAIAPKDDTDVLKT
ncbi:MAG: hypothetical protein EZS28_028165 [Streblomastix strix]|uniref:Uncharacterized protein n=1 Tax=Streblomastix strix TaxID=222440 RepID=A0A5J4V132_9EUKA|nr:MAG: hypothetical protein EZS28_028165 [Streblomastix strix]